jgi:hypothetical protein
VERLSRQRARQNVSTLGGRDRCMLLVYLLAYPHSSEMILHRKSVERGGHDGTKQVRGGRMYKV